MTHLNRENQEGGRSKAPHCESLVRLILTLCFRFAKFGLGELIKNKILVSFLPQTSQQLGEPSLTPRTQSQAQGSPWAAQP